MTLYSNFNFIFAVALTVAQPAVAATFDPSDSRQDRSALQEMLSRPEVNAALSPVAMAELEQSIMALTSGDFAASARFAERVAQSAPDVGVGWHILGLAYANAGDYDAAITALERASAAYRKNGTPDVVRGDILTLLDRSDEAQAAYEAALKRDPQLWVALIGLGDLALDRGDTEAAIVYFTAARDIAPQDAAATDRLALAQLGAGDVDGADATLVQAAAETGSPVIWRQVARLRASVGNQGGAALALSKARALSPGDLSVLTDSADLARSMGQFDEATTFLERAIAEHSEHTALSVMLARVRIDADDPEGALAALAPWQDAADTAPESVILALAVSHAAAGDLESAASFHAARTKRFPGPESFSDQSAFLLGSGDPAAAADILTEAVAAYPDAPSLRLQQGRLLAAQGDYDTAQATLAAGLQLAPDDRGLLRSASMVALRLSDPDSALTLAERATSSAEASSDDQVWLAMVAEQGGDTPKAIQAYRAALEADAGNAIALNNLAVLRTQDAPTEAVALARRAIDAAGSEPVLLDTLGWALYHEGSLEEARTHLQAALDGRATNATAHYRLGVTLMDLGQGDSGRSELEQALALDPGFSAADDARARLDTQ